jgi:hypothetical protein
MRYASNPGHVQDLNAALADMRSPELNALVAIVEAKNAVTHCVISPTTLAKKSVEALEACE